MKLTAQLPLVRPLIMGVLNVTPNSFSHDGTYRNPEVASLHAESMLHDGANIIDIGGESTGPNSVDVSFQEELARVMPVIRAIENRPSVSENFSAFISVDTYKAEVAEAVLQEGVGMINDVTALRGDSRLAKVIAAAGAYLVLMYAKDPTARTTRTALQYTNVIKTIIEFLEKRIAIAVRSGIQREKIIIDPGMGAFISSDPRYSYEVLRRLPELKKLGQPILIGASRKSFLPGLMKERLIPTIIAHTIAIQNGASFVRVHDVKEHIFLQQMVPPYPELNS